MRTLLTLCFILLIAPNAWGFWSADQSAKIEALEQEIKAVKETQETMLNGLIELEKQQKITDGFTTMLFGHTYRLNKLLPKMASINPGSKEYSVIASVSALCAISCGNIKEYSTGSEITLELINFYAATITDVKLDIEYSTIPEFSDSEDVDFAKHHELHEKNKKYTTASIAALEPATAKSVKIFIKEYKPSELKYLGVSISSSGIKFHRPKK